MKKQIIMLLLLLTVITFGQEITTGLSLDKSSEEVFVNLGERIFDLYIDPQIEGRLIATKHNDTIKI